MEPFIAQIIFFGANFPPRGWALCDGQLLAISQWTAVFSLVGTTYGGDGRTTFGLPDLRGRAPVHPGNGPGLSPVSWGQKSGIENVTLLSQNLPSHSHSIQASTDTGTTPDPTGAFLANAKRFDNDFIPGPNNENLVNMAAGAVGNAGGGQSFNIRNPYLGVYAIFALQGIFPSRN